MNERDQMFSLLELEGIGGDQIANLEGVMVWGESSEGLGECLYLHRWQHAP